MKSLNSSEIRLVSQGEDVFCLCLDRILPQKSVRFEWVDSIHAWKREDFCLWGKSFLIQKCVGKLQSFHCKRLVTQGCIARKILKPAWLFFDMNIFICIRSCFYTLWSIVGLGTFSFSWCFPCFGYGSLAVRFYGTENNFFIISYFCPTAWRTFCKPIRFF